MSKVILTPRAALQLLSRPLLIAFAFSFFVNVLALTLPIYMMVVYDKVLTSRSLETLIALSVMAVFALVCYGLLEAVRARIAQGIDRWLDENMTGEIQRLQLENAAAARKKLPGGLGDLRNLRQAFSGPPLFAVFDTVWAPLFLLVIFLIHPLLGAIACGGAVALLLLAVVTEVLVRAPQKIANGFTTQTGEISQLATRNAEAVEALGMTAAVVDRITKSAADARAHLMMATRRSSDMTNVTMVVRLLIQIALVACRALAYPRPRHDRRCNDCQFAHHGARARAVPADDAYLANHCNGADGIRSARHFFVFTARGPLGDDISAPQRTRDCRERDLCAPGWPETDPHRDQYAASPRRSAWHPWAVGCGEIDAGARASRGMAAHGGKSPSRRHRYFHMVSRGSRAPYRLRAAGRRIAGGYGAREHCAL